MVWNKIEKREQNNPPDSFQPQNAFEGYMKASLENINGRLDRLPCSETFERLGKLENKVANIQGKATIIGAITGFIAGAFSKMFMGR